MEAISVKSTVQGIDRTYGDKSGERTENFFTENRQNRRNTLLPKRERQQNLADEKEKSSTLEKAVEI
jgi:hypothetical protein